MNAIHPASTQSDRSFTSSNRPLFVMIATVVCLGLYIASTERPTSSFSTNAQTREKVSLDLLIKDGPQGSVLLENAADRKPVGEFKGEAGFVRTALRGLAAERIRRGIGPELPFRLSLLEDGRLILRDPTTERAIELKAFGSTNAAEFARLLPAAKN